MFQTSSSQSRRKAQTDNGRESRILPWHFSQILVRARIAAQTVVSQAIALLWLIVAVGGGLGLLGVAFNTISAKPNSATMDLYHPLDVVTSSRTIRYDRHPRRPSVVTIATGVIVAIMVLAVVWMQLAFFSGHATTVTTRAVPGQISASARRKDNDQSNGPDPMSMGGADEDLGRTAHEWWIETAKKAGVDLTGHDPTAPLAERVAWAAPPPPTDAMKALFNG